MTRAEFYDKYGDELLEFVRHYKYTFYYTGKMADGRTITCAYGGSPQDIYRCEVVPGCKESLASIHPYEGAVADNGVTGDSFYDY